jgi:Sec-independent protein translocase protein TatA
MLAVIALVVVGPKDLPRLMRMAVKWVRKGKSVTDRLCAEMIAPRYKAALQSHG